MSSFERELIRGLKTLNLPGGIQKSSAILLHTKIVCNHLSWPSKNIYCISRQILGSPDTFWAVRTYFQLSGHILNCPDIFWLWEHILDFLDLYSRLVFRRPRPKIFRMDPNQLGGNATLQPAFLGLWNWKRLVETAGGQMAPVHMLIQAVRAISFFYSAMS